MIQITEFQIWDLYGYKNFNIKIKDNTLIIVGENGAGKTTVLRLLYYFITGQWTALSKFNFKKLSIKINGKKFTVAHKDISKKIKSNSRNLLRKFSDNTRHKLLKIAEEYDEDYIYSNIITLSEQFNLPARFIMQFVESLNNNEENTGKELFDTLKNFKKEFKSQILYLPTYRRIEQELNLIFQNCDKRRIEHDYKLNSLKTENGNHVELIEFGMNDVDIAIDKTLSKLKDFAHENLNTLTLGYLGDVVDRKYLSVDTDQIMKVTNETVEKVLKRISETILSTSSKKSLFSVIQKIKNKENYDEYEKVICHYFLKLLSFQQELEKKERHIRNFCNVCNEYMVDKTFRYDSSSFQFFIKNKDRKSDKDLQLQQLSSGEKQIVSLFSHLYLSDKKSFFVLIDEPELSLSVPWQRRFLMDIRKGCFCDGLIAVTHSPFIYDNELVPFACSLGEFMEDSL